MTLSQPSTIQELKRTFVAAGLEIYRTKPDAVHLAERPRENQILDAGIAVRPTGQQFELRLVMRAQRSDFPRDAAEQLYDRVLDFAGNDVLGHGYAEAERREQHMLDPGDRERTLDVWYEVVFVHQFADVEAVIAEVRRILPLEKYVPGGS